MTASTDTPTPFSTTVTDGSITTDSALARRACFRGYAIVGRAGTVTCSETTSAGPRQLHNADASAADGVPPTVTTRINYIALAVKDLEALGYTDIMGFDLVKVEIAKMRAEGPPPSTDGLGR